MLNDVVNELLDADEFFLVRYLTVQVDFLVFALILFDVEKALQITKCVICNFFREAIAYNSSLASWVYAATIDE